MSFSSIHVSLSNLEYLIDTDSVEWITSLATSLCRFSSMTSGGFFLGNPSHKKEIMADNSNIRELSEEQFVGKGINNNCHLME